MNNYTLTYKDSKGNDHNVTLEARSGTHAILLAMEQSYELKLHPNRITRVLKEKKTDG